ncbi:mitotic spindle assembly checkpoint protein MAD2 [Rhodotorula toruloides]|uniref:Mitotic spindle assembly checkpoint protein MAD2 n=1 Tax=Rhodotorula toruloides TaxID=5286 RepID=A0A511K8I8_RHOTO|nr:mitotic spindle assembly checkpoint protein MAD2 [Rhodotorula toruloides]
MATKRKQGQMLSLKGSTKIVTEFFEYSVNSILYQRGIYPPEDFKQVKKYGLTLFTSADEALERYISNVMKQVQTWILAGKLDSLALIVMNRDTREVVERWQFDIQVEETAGEGDGKENEGLSGAKSNPDEPLKQEKTPEQVQKDIQDIMRQITSSVTFLPSLEDKYVFTILTYAKKDTEVPKEWIDSDPHMIIGNAEQVKLRTFSTNRHKVQGLVAYRLGQDVL